MNIHSIYGSVTKPGLYRTLMAIWIPFYESIKRESSGFPSTAPVSECKCIINVKTVGAMLMPSKCKADAERVSVLLMLL